MADKKNANPTSVRLTEEEKALQKGLAQHFGVSDNDILKMALRVLARQEGVKIEAQKAK